MYEDEIAYAKKQTADIVGHLQDEYSSAKRKLNDEYEEKERAYNDEMRSLDKQDKS
jgi:hypothetical protein